MNSLQVSDLPLQQILMLICLNPLDSTNLRGSSLVGLVFVFLCVNGHFMGQDWKCHETPRNALLRPPDLGELEGA